MQIHAPSGCGSEPHDDVMRDMQSLLEMMSLDVVDEGRGRMENRSCLVFSKEGRKRSRPGVGIVGIAGSQVHE